MTQDNIIWYIVIGQVVLGWVLSFVFYSPQDKSVWLDLQNQILEDNTLLIMTFNNLDESLQEKIIQNFDKLQILSVESKSISIKTKFEDYVIVFRVPNEEDIPKLKEFIMEYQIVDYRRIKNNPLSYIVEIKKKVK